MCGRFAFGARLEQALVDLDVQTTLNPDPRWNIAPTDLHPMLMHDEGDLDVALGRWGFTARTEALKAPINARLETATEKPVFAEAMRTARMAAPATGWYEWMTSPVGRHPHHHTLVDGEIMWLAGVLHPVGLEGFALLTKDATAAIAHVHPRMPVALAPHEVEAWLEHGTLPAIQAPVTSWAVGMDVNHTSRDGAHLCEPIPTLF